MIQCEWVKTIIVAPWYGTDGHGCSWTASKSWWNKWAKSLIDLGDFCNRWQLTHVNIVLASAICAPWPADKAWRWCSTLMEEREGSVRADKTKKDWSRGTITKHMELTRVLKRRGCIHCGQQRGCMSTVKLPNNYSQQFDHCTIWLVNYLYIPYSAASKNKSRNAWNKSDSNRMNLNVPS